MTRHTVALLGHAGVVHTLDADGDPCEATPVPTGAVSGAPRGARVSTHTVTPPWTYETLDATMRLQETQRYPCPGVPSPWILQVAQKLCASHCSGHIALALF